MAKDSYKKRMKGGWNQGKACKGNGSERAYAKAEIRQFIKEMDEGYKDPYRKSQRKKNEKARLEYRISYFENAAARYNKTGYVSSWVTTELAKAKKLYAEKFGDIACEGYCDWAGTESSCPAHGKKGK